jgi:hypothetical protein
MYSWIWRKLPGGTISKILISLVLLTGIALFMFTVGFPAIEDYFNVDQTTLTE